MKTVAWMFAAALLTVPVTAADPPGFVMWRASDELKAHDVSLSTHVGADHSSRETLAEYTDHRFRMLYRDADGNPEQHDAIIDVVLVQSGEGTLVVGGTMVGQPVRRGQASWSARGSTAANSTRSEPATSSTSPPAFRTASSCPRGSI